MSTSETQHEQPNRLRQLLSLPILPAIGLSLLAYRLLGKRCIYRWGNFDVTPQEQLSRNDYRFVRIFPAAVILFGLILTLLIGAAVGLPLS